MVQDAYHHLETTRLDKPLSNNVCELSVFSVKSDVKQLELYSIYGVRGLKDGCVDLTDFIDKMCWKITANLAKMFILQIG